MIEATPGAPVEFPYEANAVRARLGLNKEEERALRKSALKNAPGKKRLWTKHKKRIYLSEEGLQRMVEASGVVAPAIAKNARPGANAGDGEAVKAVVSSIEKAGDQVTEEEALRVVKCNCANKRIILAAREPKATRTADEPMRRDGKSLAAETAAFRRAEGVPMAELVRVKVKDSSVFRRGWLISGRKIAGYSDLYELTSRVPRAARKEVA